MKSDNLYITALEYAEEKFNSREGVTFFALKKYLDEKDYAFDLTKNPDLTQFRLLYTSITGVSRYPHKENDGRDFPYNMSTEAYFNLLEYKELKEARSASETAMKRSTIAIIISIFSMIIGSALSIYQLNTPATLDDQTVHELKILKYDDTNIKNSVESIETKQGNILKELRSINDANKSFNQTSEKP